MSDVAQEGVKNWDHGAKSSIGATALQLTSATQAYKGIQVKADAANTGIVYIGKSDVTANSADATDGFPLAAGEEVFIPTDNPSAVYGVGSAAGQKVFFAYA